MQARDLHRLGDEAAHAGHVLGDLAQRAFQALMLHVQFLVDDLDRVDLASEHPDQLGNLDPDLLADIFHLFIDEFQLGLELEDVLAVLADALEFTLKRLTPRFVPSPG